MGSSCTRSTEMPRREARGKGRVTGPAPSSVLIAEGAHRGLVVGPARAGLDPDLQKDRAVEALDASLKLGPNQPEARKLVDELKR